MGGQTTPLISANGVADHPHFGWLQGWNGVTKISLVDGILWRRYLIALYP